MIYFDDLVSEGEAVNVFRPKGHAHRMRVRREGETWRLEDESHPPSPGCDCDACALVRRTMGTFS